MLLLVWGGPEHGMIRTAFLTVGGLHHGVSICLLSRIAGGIVRLMPLSRPSTAGESLPASIRTLCRLTDSFSKTHKARFKILVDHASRGALLPGGVGTQNYESGSPSARSVSDER